MDGLHATVEGNDGAAAGVRGVYDIKGILLAGEVG